MPIKPENLSRYPKNWSEISKRIRHRAGNKCEFCGIGNGWIGYRNESGKFVCIAEFGKPQNWEDHATGYRVFRVVLTVAHLNHEPSDCSDENLKALCQKCHLAYDAEHHKRNAALTRRALKMTNELFNED